MSSDLDLEEKVKKQVSTSDLSATIAVDGEYYTWADSFLLIINKIPMPPLFIFTHKYSLPGHAGRKSESRELIINQMGACKEVETIYQFIEEKTRY